MDKKRSHESRREALGVEEGGPGMEDRKEEGGMEWEIDLIIHEYTTMKPTTLYNHYAAIQYIPVTLFP